MKGRDYVHIIGVCFVLFVVGIIILGSGRAELDRFPCLYPKRGWALTVTGIGIMVLSLLLGYEILSFSKAEYNLDISSEKEIFALNPIGDTYFIEDEDVITFAIDRGDYSEIVSKPRSLVQFVKGEEPSGIATLRVVTIEKKRGWIIYRRSKHSTILDVIIELPG